MSFRYAGIFFDLAFLSDDDLIAKYIGRDGTFYEIDLLEYLAVMLGRRATIIDVGAQIGNHAVFFGSFMADKVVCVEPNPSIIPILSSNVSRHHGNFVIIAAGLGAREGSGRLHQPDPGNCGTMQVQLGDGDVSITTLDAIVQGDVSLVKIDVEGMELDVLRGGTNLLRTQHPDLVIEAATRAHFEAHRDFLAQFGYVPMSRWAVTPTWHYAWRPSFGRRCHARLLRMRFSIKRSLIRLAERLRLVLG